MSIPSIYQVASVQVAGLTGAWYGNLEITILAAIAMGLFMTRFPGVAWHR